MLRDVFYYGNKPNVHPREKFAKDLADARKQSTTEHFWIINEFCDYTEFDWDFDFDFLSDDLVWTSDHVNVWPSKYQKDSGTWLCNKRHSDIIVYRNDVESLKRKPIRTSNWVIKGKIDESRFDFAWHPDPTEPPYIYQFPSQWNKTGGPRYHVEGATEVKYVTSQVAFRLADKRHWKLNDSCDADNFDYSWHPDDTDPPYIYQFGTQWQKTGGPQYIVPGATKVKYEGSIAAKRLSNMDYWTIPDYIDVTNFDFSWHPDDSDPLYIYEFGTQWQKTGGPVYNTPGATEKKYVDYQKAKALPQPKKFRVQNNYKIKDFDYSWHPDATEEAYVYVFGNQHYPAEKMPTITYRVIGAREEKFINDIHATLDVDKTHWLIPNDIDDTGFDYSWIPDPGDPPYVYLFGTQHQKTGGPKYVPDGIVVLPNGKALGEYKYIDTQRVKKLPDISKFEVAKNIDVESFDFSWHPDETDLPYIYEFATQWQGNGGPRYVVPGATQVKYVDSIKAKRLPSEENWTIPKNVDVSDFDFSWHPDATSPPFIYQFGTQWQKTGGPSYNVPNATEKKYIDVVKAKALPQPKKFRVQNNYKIKDFDYSWHPDETEEPFVYIFGNQYYSAEKMPTIVYRVIGAREEKFINDIHATLDQDKTHWQIPEYLDVSDFDFSWVPDPGDPKDFIYEFPTVWNDRGGPRYINPDVVVLPNGKPLGTFKYMTEPKVKCLPDMSNWIVPEKIDTTGFDFSWRPHPDDPPYAYEFGTQHQKTGGPIFVTPGITVLPNGKVLGEVKYVDTQKVKKLPDPDKFKVLVNHKIKDFDYSWHPDNTESGYTYVFGNQHYSAEKMPTISYGEGFKDNIKYVDTIVATLEQDRTNWIIPKNINDNQFDYSWVPDPGDPLFIYQFGTQWQKTGGPKYVPAGIVVLANGKALGEYKYMDFQRVTKLPEPDKFTVPSYCSGEGFDYSWHPDDTELPYIYEFGTQWQSNGGIRYVVEGASSVKYVESQKCIRLPSRENWNIPDHVDVAGFDFSWHPDVTSPPFIYQFGTQHQKTGGPSYVVPGATGKKFIDFQKVKALPQPKKFRIENNYKIKDFDFSWHPDDTEDPYVYVFGNQHHSAEKMPTIIYRVLDARENKYIDHIKATLAEDKTNWQIPDYIDESSFDFSWMPDPGEPKDYIYEFPTVWHDKGGPRYITPGIVILPNGKPLGTFKYMEGPKAKVKTNTKNWIIPNDVDVTDFDFSWVPHPDDPAYIYQFGTQWQKTGGPQYVPAGTPLLPNGKPIGEVKYLDTQHVKKLPSRDKFTVLEGFHIEDFDYSWHPDETETGFTYVFGNQHYSAEKMPTIKYGNGFKDNYKYIDSIVARIKPSKKNWEIPDYIDETGFDFSWIPDPDSPPYIYEFATVWNNRGGPKYVVPGATDYKYMEDIKAKCKPSLENWVIPNSVDRTTWDFSWRPHPDAPPYIYEFATVWNNRGGPKYVVPGSKEFKYVEDIKARLLPSKQNWQIPDYIDSASFDFSWRPHPEAPPYIYEFATVWNNRGGPKYIVPGATDYKYMEDIKAKCKPSLENWVIPNSVDRTTWDFSWRPHPDNPPYTYEFATVWNNRGGPKYVVSGSKEFKYVEDIKAKLLPSKQNWQIPDYIDSASFDFSWRPHPEAPAYIYEFATVWNNRGGPKYTVPGAKEYSYVENIRAKCKPSKDNWEIPTGVDVSDFDFSWRPHPEAPAYIYQFGTLKDDNDGPRYVTPGHNNEIVNLPRVYVEVVEVLENTKDDRLYVPRYYIETTLEALVNQHPDEIFWALRSNINYDNFNFDWRPIVVHVAYESDYVHVFGSPDSEITQTYFVNANAYLSGKKDFKFIEDKNLNEEYLSNLFVRPDIFLVDRGNPETQERYNYLKSKFTNVQKTRFFNNWVDTINRCINRSNTELCWILNSELDYSEFDFNYYPNPWQLNMVHIFGTQWSHWGTTYIVNKNSFPEDTKYIKVIEHLKNLNFVKDRRAKATNNLHDVYVIDHGNIETDVVVAKIKSKINGKNIKIIPYDQSYLNTIKNIVKDIAPKKEHYIWITSSICDYSEFSFDYICDPFAKDNLHVFPSGSQKFGDTFLLDVNKTRELIDDMQILQQYHKINYTGVRTKRLPAPVISSEKDTHVGCLNVEFDFPYAVFQTEKIDAAEDEPMCLWSDDTKNILVTSTGATRIVVPKEAKDYIKKEFYDYPYIKTASRLVDSKPLDIVFLSNGEKGAEENYEHLLAVTKGLKNRIVRVDGVNGRVAAYHAAVLSSNTPWAFTVFAKLKINPKFDFSWQPDRMQSPKHYIFHAKNPINGLEYGHQGMIAYNKKLTLANTGKGLDFTLDDPHETIEMLSGTAVFNTDPYSTWRTAFREVIKLKSDFADISQERLQTWLTKAKGKFAEDCLQGAKDAVEYYDEVGGDIDQLKLSYEWVWLQDYYNRKYK